MGQLAADIGPAPRHVLKSLAVSGALGGTVTVSCSELADRLNVSNQTASRRLQTLDEAGMIERELLANGQAIELTPDGERVLLEEYETYRSLFEGDSPLTFRGIVTTGMGEGRHYISLDGYHRQFVERLGYEPYPGTLNLTLEGESVRRRSRLETQPSTHIDGWSDEQRTYGPAFCYPAVAVTEDGREYDEVHVIVPERTHHDEDELELIAPDKLRDVLELADDGTLIVELEEGDRA